MFLHGIGPGGVVVSVGSVPWDGLPPGVQRVPPGLGPGGPPRLSRGGAAYPSRCRALGLFAAIPAVVVYNVFARAVGGYRALLSDGTALTMRLVSRDCERVPMRMSRAAE